MKAELLEKTIQNGRLANELVAHPGYQMLLSKLSEKRESVRQDALNSKTIEDLRYGKGFLDGLDFFESTVGQMIQRAETQKKRI